MMGVYDTLIDGDKQAQIKCFDCEMNTYKVGDKIPRDGTFIIVLPPRENKRYAIIKDSIFLGLTDRMPAIIDKWGCYLISCDDFRDHPAELVEKISKEAKMEADG